jgi:hypothetical protein
MVAQIQTQNQIIQRIPSCFQLIEFLKLRQFLFSIPHIHKGGCGFSAYVMIKYLQFLDYNVDNINVMYSDKCLTAKQHIWKDNINNNLRSCRHILLLEDGIIFDCEQIEYNLSDFLNHSQFDLLKFVNCGNEKAFLDFKTAILNRNDWNNKFKYKRAITKINKFLNFEFLTESDL